MLRLVLFAGMAFFLAATRLPAAALAASQPAQDSPTAQSQDGSQDQDDSPVQDASQGGASQDSDAEALYQKGLAFEKAKHFEEALDAFQSALDADGSLEKADREMGLCYYQLGWRDQALIHLQDYLASGIDDPQSLAFMDSLQDQQDKIAALEGAYGLALAGPFSLQAEIGYGFGFNEATYGHRFNRENNANPFSYDYSVGQGFTYALEPLLEVNPNLALGVAIMPVLTRASGSSSNTLAGATETDSTRVESLAIPVILTLHTRVTLAPGLKVSCFAGVGGVYSQPYVETASDTISDGASNTTEAIRYQRDYSPNLAFRGGFTLDWILAAHFSAFLDCSVLLAHLAATSVNYSAIVYNSKGQEIGSSTASDSFNADPPASLGTSAPIIPKSIPASSSPSSATYTYNDGPTEWTSTVTYSAAGALDPYRETFSETNVISTANGDNDINIKVLAATAGLRWEF